MELIYKTLCEVKLEHEYFLTREDGTSLFDEADPVKRLAILEQNFDNDRESFTRDISFEFPAYLAAEYSGLGLKVVTTYGGFRLLARVVRKTLADGSLVFAPLSAIPQDLDILVTLIRKNGLPDMYSGGRLARPVPAAYLFSNENVAGARIFPFLTTAVSAFDAGHNYEQGELALAGAALREYYYDHTGVLQPRPVTAAVTAFANENDHMLVPFRFEYSPAGPAAVTSLDITLRDSLNNEVKSFAFAQTEPIRSVALDFSDMTAAIGLSEDLKLPAAVFTLEVQGNNGYTDTKQLVFLNGADPRAHWAVVHLKPVPANAAFSLIATDGYIQKRRDGGGVWTEAPVFEIPVKSRFSHLRYRNSNGRELKLNPALNNFLFKEQEALISQVPVSLCKNYFLVPDNAGTTTRYLPGPVSYQLNKDNFQRIYIDVMVPESDLFPVI